MDLDKHLIREVKNHTVLYDSNHLKYKDIDFKQQTWVEIGRKLIGKEDDTTSVTALKVRWKSLRDAYVKERKYDISRNIGLKVKAKKPWRLKKQMEFLAPFIQYREKLVAETPNTENFNHNLKIDHLNTNHHDSSKIEEEPDSFVSQGSNLSKRELFPQEMSVSKMESFFRGISDAVLGLNKKNQILVQKEIATLVMDFKLKELEQEEKSN